MSLSFIAVSDIHDDLDAVKILRKKIATFQNIQAIFVAGDISFGDTSSVFEEFSHFSKPVIVVFGNHDEYVSSSVKQSYKKKNIHILYTGEIYDIETYPNVSNEGDSSSFQKLRVIGFPYPIYDPWCVTKYHEMALDPWTTLEKRILSSYQEGFKPSQIIILAHAPPKETLDRVYTKKKNSSYSNENGSNTVYQRRFVGDPNLRDILIKHQVQLVLCGHIHEEGGKTVYLGDCLISNISSLWENDPWHPGKHYSIINFPITDRNKKPHISYWYL